ncbi:Ribonuclease I precursor [Kluyvera cryocrescens]|uniref:Ribonuclease I n=1 Tax=Kluyvera cryocrescens TaxID=580 RepID=A0A485CJT1_KLUCR|nr:Ribonuclease I precursor [Kluyvera cryocrescens]
MCQGVRYCSAPAAFTLPLSYQHNMATSTVMFWRSPGKPVFAKVSMIKTAKNQLECQQPKEATNKADYLTVHGLWPGLPGSIASRGVDNNRWMRFGCATRPIPNMPEAKAGRKCALKRPGYRWKWPIS